MYDKIVRYIAKNRMFDGKTGVVAGLSGGADSVCLFWCCEDIVWSMELLLKRCMYIMVSGVKKLTVI